jgi:hypothetical protein
MSFVNSQSEVLSYENSDEKLKSLLSFYGLERFKDQIDGDVVLIRKLADACLCVSALRTTYFRNKIQGDIFHESV